MMGTIYSKEPFSKIRRFVTVTIRRFFLLNFATKTAVEVRPTFMVSPVVCVLNKIVKKLSFQKHFLLFVYLCSLFSANLILALPSILMD